jgi:hypothetical protein
MKTLYVIYSYNGMKKINCKIKGKLKLKNFNTLSKSMKKAIRYIYQDAPIERLEEIRTLINQAIEKRLNDQK